MASATNASWTDALDNISETTQRLLMTFESVGDTLRAVDQSGVFTMRFFVEWDTLHQDFFNASRMSAEYVNSITSRFRRFQAALLLFKTTFATTNIGQTHALLLGLFLLETPHTHSAFSITQPSMMDSLNIAQTSSFLRTSNAIANILPSLFVLMSHFHSAQVHRPPESAAEAAALARAKRLLSDAAQYAGAVQAYLSMTSAMWNEIDVLHEQMVAQMLGHAQSFLTREAPQNPFISPHH